MDLKNLTADELQELANQQREKENADKQAKRQSYETLREKTIFDLSDKAIALKNKIIAFKKQSFDDLGTLHELLKEYAARQKDGKGNFTIDSADGQRRIVYKRQELGVFDERSIQAEKHIIEFINKEFEGQENKKKLILSLLERKKGTLDIKLVQRLYAMENDFDDTNWKEGIKLLKESFRTVDTKDYVNFYVKDSNNQWQLVNLNYASLQLPKSK